MTNMYRRANSSQVLRFCESLLAVCILGMVVFFCWRLVPELAKIQRAKDFAAFYIAGRLLNEGKPLYNKDAQAAAAQASGIEFYTPYIYPPFLASAFRLLAQVAYVPALILFTVVGVVAFLASLWKLQNIYSPTSSWFVAVGFGVLFITAIYDTVLLGQVNFLLSVLMVYALAYSIDRQANPARTFAGVLLGLAISIKIYPAIICLLYLVRRRCYTLGVAVATVAALFVFGMRMSGGYDQTYTWFSYVLPQISGSSGFFYNQSINGFTKRLFEIHEIQWSGQLVTIQPLLYSPVLGEFVRFGFIIVVLSVSIWVAHIARATQKDVFADLFALFLTMTLLITPIVWTHYYTLLCIPLFAVARASNTMPGVRLLGWIMLLLLVLQNSWYILAIDVPSILSSPWLGSFGFYGTLLLWLVLLRVCYSRIPASYSRKQNA